MARDNIRIKDMRTYIEEDYPLAYSRARKELGSDLILIEKKEIKIGGFFGLFAKKKLKVTFGVEPKIQKPKKIKNKQNDNEEILNLLKGMANSQKKEKKKEEKPFDSGIYKPYAKIESKKQELVKNIPNEIKKKLEGEELKEKLKREISEEIKKEMFREGLGEGKEVNNIQEDEFWLKLRKDDIGEKEIVDDIKLFFKENNYTLENRLEGMKVYFEKNIKIRENSKNKRFIMLVGPTGVGKTTSCAKIVANKWTEEGDVALVTADTYRLEAVAQLKAYANIMKVAVEVIKKPEELDMAIEKFKNKDLVVMDTAGRSPRNKEQMKHLKEYTEAKGGELEVILVLSATSKLSVLCETIEKFKNIGFSSIIFTKIDETNKIGSLLTISKKYNIAISYITDGQKVPDDIREADKTELSEIFIKGLK
ncbi:MAG: hypothetical protein B6I28_00195 [Fusobacteriia bacterium 4572_132]|nr:MAG: hypothetical protein B6I28_00195 [Fusobacteriia bacterium 4572_132]